MTEISNEKDVREHLLLQNSKNPTFDCEHRSTRTIPSRWPAGVIAWCILALGWVLLLPVVFSSRGKSCEEPFDDPMHAPLEYAKQTFAGLVDPDDLRPQDNPYGETTEDYWNTMLDVGIIKLSADEAGRLPSETSQVFGEEPAYAGNLEIFHQLHCLNRIRRMYYFPEENEYNETAESRVGHARHCFGYLEQTLKCHADVGVMSVKYNPTAKGYDPTWNVVKTCRNFELIHDWARGRKIAHAERNIHESQNDS